MCGGVVAMGGVGAGVGDTGGKGLVGGAGGAASDVGVVSRRTTGVAGGETGTACGEACTVVRISGAGGDVFGAGGDTGGDGCVCGAGLVRRGSWVACGRGTATRSCASRSSRGCWDGSGASGITGGRRAAVAVALSGAGAIVCGSVVGSPASGVCGCGGVDTGGSGILTATAGVSIARGRSTVGGWGGGEEPKWAVVRANRLPPEMARHPW